VGVAVKLKHVNLGAGYDGRYTSHNDHFTARQGNADTDWIRGWVRITTILVEVKRENHVAQK
jgi:hypothetical protein